MQRASSSYGFRVDVSAIFEDYSDVAVNIILNDCISMIRFHVIISITKHYLGYLGEYKLSSTFYKWKTYVPSDSS